MNEPKVLKADGSVFEAEVDTEDCPHKNKQTWQPAGPNPEVTACIDCGKEL